jgi:nitrogen fixation NifU-like protein
VSAELYQKLLVDHGKRPRNFGPLPGADRVAEGNNPLCGDELSLRLKLSGGRIGQIAFEGAGCAVCIGSASLLTLAVTGLLPEEASQVAAVDQGGDLGREVDEARLGDLIALSGVARFPARRKCALLAWRALEAALAGSAAPVTTE